MNSHEKGDHAELRVLALLKRMGWNVLIPYTESQQYDIIAESNNKFVRIQVKSSNYDDGTVKFKCCNTATGNSDETFYTADDIDGIAVYNESLDDVYWIPIDETNKYSMSLAEDGKNSLNEYQFESNFPNRNS